MGQINRGTILGDMIYMLAGLPDVNTVVEIGAAGGTGTTWCVKEALLKKPQYFFLSLEIDKNEWQNAINNNPEISEKFRIVNGRITDRQEVFEHYAFDPNFSSDKMQNEWRIAQYYYQQTPNVFHLVPKKIDLLILDGGELDSEVEFNKLYRRSKYIVLDDTYRNSVKFVNMRDMLLETFKVILDVTDEDDNRNGYMIIRNEVRV